MTQIRLLVLNEIGVFIFDLESNMFIANIPLMYIVFNYIICIYILHLSFEFGGCVFIWCLWNV